MVEIIILCDFKLWETLSIKRDRTEWVKRMKELYNDIRTQYTKKGKTERQASEIARKVVFRISRQNGLRVTKKELQP